MAWRWSGSRCCAPSLFWPVTRSDVYHSCTAQYSHPPSSLTLSPPSTFLRLERACAGQQRTQCGRQQVCHSTPCAATPHLTSAISGGHGPAQHVHVVAALPVEGPRQRVRGCPTRRERHHPARPVPPQQRRRAAVQRHLREKEGAVWSAQTLMNNLTHHPHPGRSPTTP